MLDAAKVLIDNIGNILRSIIVVASLWAVVKVAVKTSFGLVPVAGVLFVVFLANWAIGNIDWARNLFNKDAQKLGLEMSVVSDHGPGLANRSALPTTVQQLLHPPGDSPGSGGPAAPYRTPSDGERVAAGARQRANAGDAHV